MRLALAKETLGLAQEILQEVLQVPGVELGQLNQFGR